MTARLNAIQAFSVRNESLRSENDGTFFHNYQDISAISDTIISKLVESQSRFEKSGRKMSKIHFPVNIWAFSLFLRINLGA